MLKVFLLQKRGALCNDSKNNMGDEVFIINDVGMLVAVHDRKSNMGRKPENRWDILSFGQINNRSE